MPKGSWQPALELEAEDGLPEELVPHLCDFCKKETEARLADALFVP